MVNPSLKVSLFRDRKDPANKEKIIESELPKVFNWILDALHRLFLQKKFTHSGSVDDMVNQYKLQLDSVQLFLQDKGCTKDICEEICLKIMHHEYRVYCSESGYKSCSPKVSFERMRGQSFEFNRKKFGFVVCAVKKTMEQLIILQGISVEQLIPQIEKAIKEKISEKILLLQTI